MSASNGACPTEANEPHNTTRSWRDGMLVRQKTSEGRAPHGRNADVREGLEKVLGRGILREELTGLGPTRATLFRPKDQGQRGIAEYFEAFHYGTVFARLGRYRDKECHTMAFHRGVMEPKADDTIGSARGPRGDAANES
jgi:hypothetical protein